MVISFLLLVWTLALLQLLVLSLLVLALLVLLVALKLRQRLLDLLLPLLADLLRVLDRVLHADDVADLLFHEPVGVLDELRERSILDRRLIPIPHLSHLALGRGREESLSLNRLHRLFLLERRDRNLERDLKNILELLKNLTLHLLDTDALHLQRSTEELQRRRRPGRRRRREDRHPAVLGNGHGRTAVHRHLQLANRVAKLRDRLVALADLCFQTVNLTTGLVVFLEVPLRDVALADTTEDGSGVDGPCEGERGNRLKCAAITETHLLRLGGRGFVADVTSLEENRGRCLEEFRLTDGPNHPH